MLLGLPAIPENSPWFYVDGELAEGITQELVAEVGPRHRLYPHIASLVVIAKCGANDDVIAVDTSDYQSAFCVHLTWSGKIDKYPEKYPSAAAIPEADLGRFFREYW